MLFHRNNSVLFKRQFEQLVVIVSSDSLANNVYRNIIFPLFLIKPKSMPHYNHIVHRVEVCNWYHSSYICGTAGFRSISFVKNQVVKAMWLNWKAPISSQISHLPGIWDPNSLGGSQWPLVQNSRKHSSDYHQVSEKVPPIMVQIWLWCSLITDK